jgi:hypothetical protein
VERADKHEGVRDFCLGPAPGEPRLDGSHGWMPELDHCYMQLLMDFYFMANIFVLLLIFFPIATHWHPSS